MCTVLIACSIVWCRTAGVNLVKICVQFLPLLVFYLQNRNFRFNCKYPLWQSDPYRLAVRMQNYTSFTRATEFITLTKISNVLRTKRQILIYIPYSPVYYSTQLGETKTSVTVQNTILPNLATGPFIALGSDEMTSLFPLIDPKHSIGKHRFLHESIYCIL